MKNWTIRQRILGSFALVLVLMAAMGGMAYSRLALVDEKVTHIQRDSMPGMFFSTQLMTALVTNLSLAEAHVLQDDEAGMRQVQTRLQASRANLDGLVRNYETTIFQARDRENFEAFKKLRGTYDEAQEKLLELSAAHKDKEAHVLLRQQLEPEFDKARAALQTVVDYNKANADDASRQIFQAIRSAFNSILLLLAVALALAVVCGYYLFRAITQPLGQLVSVTDVISRGDFTQPLSMQRKDEFGSLATGFNRMTNELKMLVGEVQKSGLQINTSVTEIAATAREQQATANEVAATTTEIGATSKEIAATSKELVRTMHELATVAEQSASLASSGQTGLTHMEETMRRVMEAAGSINTKLAVLNEKAGNINQVVTTITKVADQTNLLSLNAAIEAEKAGEYGKGFSVVATEIRRLADQTAVATFDIEQIVKEIQSAVTAGVMGMDKFSEEVRRGIQEVQAVGGQLSQIILQVQAMAPRVESVNEGMQAQATGAEQISLALGQLSEASQQTVESLRQSAMAIDGLNQVSGALRGGISRFKLEATP